MEPRLSGRPPSDLGKGRAREDGHGVALPGHGPGVHPAEVVVWWSLDYEYLHPFRDFLKRFPSLPGMSLIETRRVPIPYGGVARIYRLSLSPAIEDLDRTAHSTEAPCP